MQFVIEELEAQHTPDSVLSFLQHAIDVLAADDSFRVSQADEMLVDCIYETCVHRLRSHYARDKLADVLDVVDSRCAEQRRSQRGACKALLRLNSLAGALQEVVEVGTDGFLASADDTHWLP